MSQSKEPRCQRCGTLLRSGRAVCPSCGLDLNNIAAEMAAAAQASRPTAKPVAAKSGVKMCPICMASVPAAEMVEHQNQQICGACAEVMKSKSTKKQAS